MSTNIELSYSPNDFFYVNSDIMPKAEECANFAKFSQAEWDLSCNDSGRFKDASMNCVQKELCINKDKAEKLESKVNAHKGLDKNYIDSSMQYDIAFVDVINLGIGIIFAIFIIYKNQNVV